MTTLELWAPAGALRAAPWGVGAWSEEVAWPPSPWRILVGLAQAWRRHLPQLDEAQVARLLYALAGSAPSYAMLAAPKRAQRVLPQPFSSARRPAFEARAEDVEAVRVRWASVDEANQGVLARLAARFCDDEQLQARLVPDEEVWGGLGLAPCEPDTPGSVLLATPLDPELWEERRLDLLAKRAAALLVQKHARDPDRAPQLSARDVLRLGHDVPASFLDALLAPQAVLGASELRAYAPSDVGLGPRFVVRRPPEAAPTVARYLLAGHRRPSVELALPLGELAHRALCRVSDGHPTFTGVDGEAPQRGRAYCQIIPEASPPHPSFTHLTLYAPCGFDGEAQAALQRLQHLTWDNHTLRLHLLGMGQPQDFAGTKLGAGHSLALGRSASWASFTPFVPTRQPKTTRAGAPKLDAQGHQRGGAVHDLLRLLEARGWPAPCEVRELDAALYAGKRLPWSMFVALRDHGGGQRGGGPTGFRVTFPEPVQGPLALGYGAHFGLGLFLPLLPTEPP
jgi:CRISPR-associated protein Csb2